MSTPFSLSSLLFLVYLAASLPQLHSPLPPSDELVSLAAMLRLPWARSIRGRSSLIHRWSHFPSLRGMLDAWAGELDLLDAELDSWEKSIRGDARYRGIPFSTVIPCKLATTTSGERKRRRRKRVQKRS